MGPHRVTKDICCRNTACVSHPKNMQHEVEPFFERCRSGPIPTLEISRYSYRCDRDTCA